jgi:diguanylate cyclase (GGDEF)-like protein
MSNRIPGQAIEGRARGASGQSANPWGPELFESLYDLVYSVGYRGEELERGLNELQARYGAIVFGELIYLLSHLRFESDEAEEHWRNVLSHRERMSKNLSTSVDIRVALISYFLEVNRQLENPKIIEMKLFEETRASAYRDELTGLYNYRLFREYLEQETQRSERDGSPLSIVMIDIDNFKAYNDHNGHELGNETLATVSRLLGENLRKADIAARYGGEEFALILPSTAKTAAHALAERIRESVEGHAFAGEERLPGGRLTISMGIATCPADATTSSELTRHADRAMYVAKASGKNQVQLYGQSRRSFDRVDAALPGTYRLLETVSHELTTVNLSQAGILFDTDHRPLMDSLVEIRLALPQGEVTASGHVVHVERIEGTRHQAAVHLTDAGDADREILSEYLAGLGHADPLVTS